VGRPPTPTALKLLNGSAAHDRKRLNADEPKPRVGAKSPPFLPRSGPARSAWCRLAPMLSRLRILTEADADALALGCIALAEYLDARNDENGWRRADAAWKRYAAALSWFGLNPSARVRIHAAPVEIRDPLEAWMEGSG
jgi:phage terminase small subunit